MNFSIWYQKWRDQISHIGWGAFLTLAFAHHVGVWFAALYLFIVASLKEAVFDPLVETKALQGSGWVDWAFWCLGIGLGILAAR